MKLFVHKNLSCGWLNGWLSSLKTIIPKKKGENMNQLPLFMKWINTISIDGYQHLMKFIFQYLCCVDIEDRRRRKHSRDGTIYKIKCYHDKFLHFDIAKTCDSKKFKVSRQWLSSFKRRMVLYLIADDMSSSSSSSCNYSLFKSYLIKNVENALRIIVAYLKHFGGTFHA